MFIQMKRTFRKIKKIHTTFGMDWFSSMKRQEDFLKTHLLELKKLKERIKDFK